MLTVKINDQEIEISYIPTSEEYDQLTEPQRETLMTLIALARIGKVGGYELSAILRWLNLKSTAPLWCRLLNLQEKGLIKLAINQL